MNFKKISLIFTSLLLGSLITFASDVNSILSQVQKEGFKTKLLFSTKADDKRLEVYEAIYFEKGEQIDADLILISINSNGEAKQLMRDESLVGISDINGVTKNMQAALLMGYAKVMEKEMGGRVAFEAFAKKVIKEGTGHKDLLWIFENYLGIKTH